MTDLSTLIGELRTLGGDTTSVEVKAAAGGLPESLTSTLSALANLPGGGTIILGLDERTGFTPVRLIDPQALKQGLAAKARSYTPPVVIAVEDGVVDGAPVIVGLVHETDLSAKPCRVTGSGKAYMRSYDGDYELSTIEEQAFLAQRRQPQFDRAAVTGASRQDLDDDLVSGWASTARGRDPGGLGRFSDEDELLVRAGIVTPQLIPTTAGILTLGRQPQQWFPRFVIQAAIDRHPDDPPAVRAEDHVVISGPISIMLDQALAWARRSFATGISGTVGGAVLDTSEYPITAFRELVSNALVHRDLDEWSQGLAIEIRLRNDRLVVANPGGLFGITLDRLGREGVTSARNARLLSICQFARSADSGRVVEALATGIPIVTAALNAARMPPAKFIDSGIGFTAILRKTGTVARPLKLGATQRRIYDELLTGDSTVAQLRFALRLSEPNLRRALRELRDLRLVTQIGGRGRPTTYRLVDD